MQALRELWTGAGLEEVQTRKITVQRTFADFDTFWATSTGSGSIKPTLAALPAGVLESLISRVRAKLPVDAAGRITYGAFANAVKGRMPS